MIKNSYKSKRKSIAEINVVPYIDVMLVLLIIFMVTAPFIMQGVKVDLPQANSKSLPKDEKPPLVASVDKEGRFFLNYSTVDESIPLKLDEITVLVAAELSVYPDRSVVVNGDKGVPYDQIVQLMVSLQQAGVGSVGLMTEPYEK